MPDEVDYAALLTPLLGQAGAYARTLLRHKQDAEDAVQQAALRGLQRMDTFDRARSFKAWWFTILRNCCIDALRAARAHPTQALGDDDVLAAPVPEPGGWEALSRALATLSRGHKEILQLRYFGQMSYAELAQTLDIPLGTVMSRLHLARRALAANAREDEG